MGNHHSEFLRNGTYDYVNTEPFVLPEGTEKEPMLLLDTTGSMNDAVAENSSM
jgi:hypothetical protein